MRIFSSDACHPSPATGLSAPADRTSPARRRRHLSLAVAGLTAIAATAAGSAGWAAAGDTAQSIVAPAPPPTTSLAHHHVEVTATTGTPASATTGTTVGTTTTASTTAPATTIRASSSTRPPTTATTAPTTTAPTTITTASRPATSSVVAFRGDGFGPVTVGQDGDAAHEALVAAYGAPEHEGEWYGSGTAADPRNRTVVWGPLSATFHDVDGDRRLVGGSYSLTNGYGSALPALSTGHDLGTVPGQSLLYGETLGDGRATVDSAVHTGSMCVTDAGGELCASFEGSYAEDGTVTYGPTHQAWLVIVGAATGPHCGV